MKLKKAWTAALCLGLMVLVGGPRLSAAESAAQSGSYGHGLRKLLVRSGQRAASHLLYAGLL
jgi:hypothetical protein